MGDTKSIGIAYRDQDLNGSTITNSTLNAAVLGASGGTLGFFGATPVAKAAALTTQLTTVTIADAAGTPDYALSALTTTTPYGLATQAEAITLLYVIQNLQVRMAQAESRLQAYGLMT
jgi:hypothetical protein